MNFKKIVCAFAMISTLAATLTSTGCTDRESCIALGSVVLAAAGAVVVALAANGNGYNPASTQQLNRLIDNSH